MSKIIKYTDEQKREVIGFVGSYNATNGRGGQSAAAAKFGISQLTVATWLKAAANDSVAPGEPKKATNAQDVEVVGPDWSRARQMMEGIKHAIRLSIAGQILLGHELQTLKKDLGYLGSGRRKESGHNVHFLSLNRTWDDWCKSELGVSYKTVDRLIETYEGAKSRIKKLGGEPHLIGLLETPPAKLDDEARKAIQGLVDKAVWGASQKDLIEELKIAKATDTSGLGQDTSASKAAKQKPSAEQLAFKFFTPVFHSLATARTSTDYQVYLHVLPIESDDESMITLSTLELELEQSLAEVRAAKTAKSKASKNQPVTA